MVELLAEAESGSTPVALSSNVALDDEDAETTCAHEDSIRDPTKPDSATVNHTDD